MPANVKILLIDAEPVVRSTVTSILEHEGYTVYPTADMERALEILDNAQPDLLLTNVALPGITGHDAMRIFKVRCPGIPVLMVSGLPDENIIREWMGERGWDVFPKPFAAADLVRKVKEVLSEAQSRS